MAPGDATRIINEVRKGAFKMPSKNGEPPRTNWSRILEWASIVIPVIVTTVIALITLIYYGGQFVEKMKGFGDNQKVILEQILEIKEHDKNRDQILREVYNNSKQHIGERDWVGNTEWEDN